MKRLPILLLSLMFASNFIFAQMPEIKIKSNNASDQKNVELKSMKVDVAIFGNVATTTMTMVFRNNTNRILEGELTFPMPEGVSVSKYGIDINGKIRDAVPVSKAKATEVFESIEHRQIDPGLIERVEGNNFRTRVYPLPASGERTVVVGYEEALTFDKSAMQYRLPLAYTSKIGSFDLSVKVFQNAKKPQLLETPDGSFSFSEKGNSYEASMHKSDYRPQKSLVINLPKDINVPEIVMQPNTDGSYYFLINTYFKSNIEPKKWSNKIGVIWDNSLSALHRDTKKELEFLRKIIEQKQNLTVELLLLNIDFEKVKTFNIANGNWSELRKFLEEVSYDGGTDFSAINKSLLSADEYLFFTDGLSTFGESVVNAGRRIYCINSAVRTDYSTMKYVSAKSGGKFVNLANTSIDNAVKLLNNNNLQFLGIKESDIASKIFPFLPKNISIVSQVYPSLPTEVDGNVSVAGISRSADETVTLLFGRDGKVEFEQKIKLVANPTDIDVSKIWAQKKIAELDINYTANKDDIEQIGKEFCIVTRNTSLIVLEDIMDYVRYEITPPNELLDRYNQIMKNQFAQREQRINNLLQVAISKTEELKTWWNTDFKPVRKYPKPVNDKAVPTTDISDADSDVALDAMIIERRDVVQEEMVESEAVFSMAYSTSRVQESPMANKSMQEQKSKETAVPQAQVPKIKIPKIQSDKDYIKAIEIAKNPYKQYIALREKYMGTPSYFLDVANYFYNKNDAKTALLVLSSIADLGLENAELFKILAYKMKEKGEYKRELFITSKIREWRPMDAQSHRDYALALQNNGRYQEALEVLYSVLNASYSPEAALRDRGIEEIIVAEINNLISLQRKNLKLSDIEPKIIADLPVDVRVVINWNKNDTDIDLWVTDPNGEKCMYSHNRTAIGGRLSNDITRGFGPEQFMLKKAVSGKYKIETNFFGERQLSISGPTTIMAEIYLYYSDGRQTRQIITFQSGEQGKERNGILIGEFTF